MRYIILISIILLIPIIAVAQEEPKATCPGCDLSLSGFAIGGFFGVGTFSVDIDSPQVSEQMGIDAVPQYAFRAGGGFYFYPHSKFRFGVLGGMNWAGASENDRYVKANAMWGVLMPEIVRTTGLIRLTAGLGVGGGLASVKIKEGSFSAEDRVPLFALYPRAAFEVPFGENVIFAVDLSYLCLVGEDKTLSWEISDEPRELRFTPIEFGGPSVSMSLYFGKVRELLPVETGGQ